MGNVPSVKLSELIFQHLKHFCLNWKHGDVAGLLFMLDLLSFFLSGAFMSIEFLINDVFVWGFSLLLFIDLGVNTALTELIGQPSLQGPACFYGNQMPSYYTELLFIFFCNSRILSLMRNLPLENIWIAFCLHGLAFVGVFQRIYRIVNGTDQLLAGAAIGLVESVVFNIVMELVFRHFGQVVEKNPLYKYLGITNRFYGKRDTIE